MQKLTHQDLNFVVRRLPRDIRELMKTMPLFVAGGFVRETIAGGDVKDIDLFGPSRVVLEGAAAAISAGREVKMHSTPNAITVLAPPRMPVQFITRWVFDDKQKLVASFDFTVCQAVIWFDPATRLFTSLAGDAFYSDLAARRLVYTFPERDEEAGGSMMRVRKFLARGYNIQADSLAGVIARIAMSVRTAELPHYDGPRGEERSMAHVMAGLLHEVDPSLVVDGLEPIDEHQVI